MTTQKQKNAIKVLIHSDDIFYQDISENAIQKLPASLKHSLEKSPEYDIEKINTIKTKIETHTYTINPHQIEKIASSLLDATIYF